MSLRFPLIALGLVLTSAAPPSVACGPAGLQGLYLWPMQLTQGNLSCQVSVHLMFDGQGRGWMQPIDASCPRPGGAGAGATAFRYTIDEECSGRLTDAHGHFQLELERDEVELSAERSGAWRITGVALRQRELTPGELALVVGGKARKPARPAAPAAR